VPVTQAGTGSVCCRSISVLPCSHCLYQASLLQGDALLSHASSHGRHLTRGQGHTDAMRPPPVPRSPGLASSCLLGSHGGAPALGRPTSAPRGRAGCPMRRRPLWGGQRLGRGGRGGRGGWRARPLGPSSLPVCAWMLAPPCAAWGPRRLGASSCAVAQSLPTPCHHETPRARRALGPPGPRAGVRAALAPERPGFFTPLAVGTAPRPGPQHTWRPRPHPPGPAW
jgi:hypothetical protein